MGDELGAKVTLYTTACKEVAGGAAADRELSWVLCDDPREAGSGAQSVREGLRGLCVDTALIPSVDSRN